MESNPLKAALAGHRLVLASGSPRRRQLLGELGVEFTIASVDSVDESFDASTPALDVAPMLAERKARHYLASESWQSGDIVITADTVVVIEGQVLGKPTDAADARRMLHTLSGKTHQVVTGVCVASEEGVVCRRAVTDVTFAPLTDAEIDYYVDTYSPLDKAGAYGIQEWIGLIGIKAISGSYYNVMGLPMRILYETIHLLKRGGFEAV